MTILERIWWDRHSACPASRGITPDSDPAYVGADLRVRPGQTHGSAPTIDARVRGHDDRQSRLLGGTVPLKTRCHLFKSESVSDRYPMHPKEFLCNWKT